MSSPLISCQSPATDCGRLSAGSNSTIASTMHPILDSNNMQPDAEDLEVIQCCCEDIIRDLFVNVV